MTPKKKQRKYRARQAYTPSNGTPSDTERWVAAHRANGVWLSILAERAPESSKHAEHDAGGVR